jgi:hypothetical protein
MPKVSPTRRQQLLAIHGLLACLVKITRMHGGVVLSSVTELFFCGAWPSSDLKRLIPDIDTISLKRDRKSVWQMV